MRTKRLTREMALIGVGLGSAVVAGGVGAFGLSGCSNNSGSNSGTDASMEAAVEAAVEGGGDGNVGPGPDASEAGTTDAGDGAVVTKLGPKIYVVHASPDAPSVRLCFGIGTPSSAGYSIAPFPPLPDTPEGLQPGTGGLFSAPNGIDISGLTLTVYAVSAAALATETADAPDGGEITCDHLISVAGVTDGGSPEAGSAEAGASDAASTFLPGDEYVQVGTIVKNTLADGKSYVVAVTGCAPGQPADSGTAASCGSNYSTTTGNLALTPFVLDNTTPLDAGTLGAQFAHASVEWQAFEKANPGNFTGAGLYAQGAPPADAGPEAGPSTTISLVAAPLGFGVISPMTLKPVSGLTYDGKSGAFAAIGSSSTSYVGTPLYQPFPIIDQLTYGKAVPEAGAVQNGMGFVFVLVGDPQQALVTDAGVNLRAAHFLAFPTSNP